MRRAGEKENYSSWRILSVRKAWINTAEKPPVAVLTLKCIEMITLVGGLTLESDEATLQLNTFTGFRIAKYMAEENTSRLAANMVLPRQLEIMVDAMLAVMGNGIASEDGVDRDILAVSGRASLSSEFTAGSTELYFLARRLWLGSYGSELGDRGHPGARLQASVNAVLRCDGIPHDRQHSINHDFQLLREDHVCSQPMSPQVMYAATRSPVKALSWSVVSSEACAKSPSRACIRTHFGLYIAVFSSVLIQAFRRVRFHHGE